MTVTWIKSESVTVNPNKDNSDQVKGHQMLNCVQEFRSQGTRIAYRDLNHVMCALEIERTPRFVASGKRAQRKWKSKKM